MPLWPRRGIGGECQWLAVWFSAAAAACAPLVSAPDASPHSLYSCSTTQCSFGCQPSPSELSQYGLSARYGQTNPMDAWVGAAPWSQQCGTAQYCNPVIPMSSGSVAVGSSGVCSVCENASCGCTDMLAPNFDPAALHEDGTCAYDVMCPNGTASPFNASTSNVTVNGDPMNAKESSVAGVGLWGGTCTCPNGEVYQVGDNNDGCSSIACVGGISGTCDANNPGGGGVKVTCNYPWPLTAAEEAEAAVRAAAWRCPVAVQAACAGSNTCEPADYTVASRLARDGGSTLVRFANISGNVSPDGNGGGVSVRGHTVDGGATMLITRSIFTRNKNPNQNGMGGAVFARGSRLSVSFTIFSANAAGNVTAGNTNGFGGAIAVLNCSTTISFCTFHGNSAQAGGAIWVEGDASIDASWTLEISQSTFTANSATYGGAIYCSRGALLMAFTTFSDNTVGGSNDGSGDHLYSTKMSFVKISGTVFNPLVDGGISPSVQVAGVLAGCAQHPCPLGQACAYSNYSLSCSPCPNKMYGPDGLNCHMCEAGQGPIGSACATCAPGRYSTFGVCDVCAPGQHPNPDQTACIDCPLGTTGTGTACNLCSSGFFGFVKNGSCTSCTAIELKFREDREQSGRFQRLGAPTPIFTDRAVCPGGTPGESAGICPLQGLWLHTPSATAIPTLLACEAGTACISAASSGEFTCDSEFLVRRNIIGLSAGAACGAGSTGFMCSGCKKGFSKVGRQCVQCPGFDTSVMGYTVFTILAISMLLLHNSTHVNVSREELSLIWDTVDVHRSGCLTHEDCSKLFTIIGVGPLPPESMPNQIREVELKDGGGAMHKKDFLTSRSKASSTAACMGVAIFFAQTFSLIASDSSPWFGVMKVLNLDLEEAAGKCVSALSYSERFYSVSLLLPVAVFVGVVLCVPIWNLLAYAQAWWDELAAPSRIDAVSFKRALLNAFVFCFAPLTKSAIDVLVCVPSCEDEDTSDCVPLLYEDWSVRCFEGTHILATRMAILVLIIVALVIPGVLLWLARSSRLQRDIGLNLTQQQMERWFDEHDADRSGRLDHSEIHALLRRTGLSVSQQAVSKMLRGLGMDDKGSISKTECAEWFRGHLATLMQTEFDALHGTTESGAYYWFVLVLCLKLLVNAICAFGKAGAIDWHVGLHVLFGIAIVVAAKQQPYLSILARDMELCSLLSLTGLSHIASIYQGEQSWEPVYLWLSLVLFTAPFAMFIVSTVFANRIARAVYPSVAERSPPQLTSGSWCESDSLTSRPVPVSTRDWISSWSFANKTEEVTQLTVQVSDASPREPLSVSISSPRSPWSPSPTSRLWTPNSGVRNSTPLARSRSGRPWSPAGMPLPPSRGSAHRRAGEVSFPVQVVDGEEVSLPCTAETPTLNGYDDQDDNSPSP